MRLFRPIALAALLAGGCQEKVHVEFQCTMKAHGLDCTAHEDKGQGRVEACFDFKATCGNGALVTAAHNCAKVGHGKTEQITIAEAQLHGLDKCEQKAGVEPKMELTNLTIDEQPGEVDPPKPTPPAMPDIPIQEPAKPDVPVEKPATP